MTRRILLAVLAMAATALIGRSASASQAATQAATQAAAQPTSESALSVDDQIREAVFRDLFKQNASGMQERAPVYFLSIDEGDKRRDPSSALMARFAEHKPRVEPVSRAEVSFDKGAIHRDTGERGLIFKIGGIERIGDDLAIVEGGYYEGNLSASGNTFRVERKAGIWVVTANKMEWIA